MKVKVLKSRGELGFRAIGSIYDIPYKELAERMIANGYVEQVKTVKKKTAKPAKPVE